MNNTRENLQKLFIEEVDILKDEKLVDSASKVFLIERSSGKIIFRDFKHLTDKQRIAVLLAGKYFAAKSGTIESHTTSIGNMANELGRPSTSLSGPLRQLVNEGLVEALKDRTYSIVPHRVSEILEGILSSTKQG